MDKEILLFGDIEIGKKKIKKNYYYKIPILLRGVDIEKVLASNKISFSEKNYKHFIAYLYNNHKVKPLHISKHYI